MELLINKIKAATAILLSIALILLPTYFYDKEALLKAWNRIEKKIKEHQINIYKPAGITAWILSNLYRINIKNKNNNTTLKKHIIVTGAARTGKSIFSKKTSQYYHTEMVQVDTLRKHIRYKNDSNKYEDNYKKAQKACTILLKKLKKYTVLEGDLFIDNKHPIEYDTLEYNYKLDGINEIKNKMKLDVVIIIRDYSTVENCRNILTNYSKDNNCWLNMYNSEIIKKVAHNSFHRNKELIELTEKYDFITCILDEKNYTNSLEKCFYNYINNNSRDT